MDFYLLTGQGDHATRAPNTTGTVQVFPPIPPPMAPPRRYASTQAKGTSSDSGPSHAVDGSKSGSPVGTYFRVVI